MIPTCRLIARMPKGPERHHWQVMLLLVLIFLTGYLGYLWVYWNHHVQVSDLIVPGIFFLGAFFVWLSANLSLRTAVALLRTKFLEEECISDPLTGAFNRRCLDRRLGEEITRALRHGLPLSVLLLDIDHFKQINDKHGHRVGDQALALFVKLIKGELREPDLLARYGGDEFMVIAPHTTHQSAVNLAERLRARFESNMFNLRGNHDAAQAISMTCSIGVASICNELDSTERIIHFADGNLYRAKRDGRNRICANEPNAIKPDADANDGVLSFSV